MIEIKGYHATTKENANEIIKSEFVPSIKTNEWLGHGIYFFKYKVDAESWANSNRYKNRDKAIILCDLFTDEIYYLDLDNPEELSKFNEESDKLFNNLLGVQGLGFKSEKEKICFALNAYKLAHNIEIVTYTYKNLRTQRNMRLAGGMLDKDIGYNEVQICVKNESCIKNKELLKGVV